MAISRYRNINELKVNGSGSRYYETVDFPSKEQLDGIATFKVRASNFERLDHLAFKHLGQGEYWWVIALLNDVDWMYVFEEGKVLRIPINVEDVLRLL
jgi:hypothetical protein